ncbi:hypothetical protein ABLE93_03375 [Xanthobacter sp. KR7-65]|uniref:hypothetical protein n=1 Tax=Xanthobacter sp. KR7-65 TaxID=3156612 RepID=UPI0032B5EB3E
MTGRCEMEFGHFSLSRLGDGNGCASPADPDVLARAVRAHKEGDAVAQALLTLALMLAIGAVAVVLSVGHAAAASQLIVNGMWDHSAVLLVLAAVGTGALFAIRYARRAAPARIDGRSHAPRSRAR